MRSIDEPCEDPTALPNGAVVGRYQVVDRLGAGGIATVYAVRHVQRGTLHALKVLTLDRPSVRERTVREGQVQHAIRHPNLVAVTEITGFQGTPALVMEYVAGPSLDELLTRRRLSLPEVDLLGRHVLRGMARAHSLGVVHRDLKPGNVLLHCIDDRIVAKVSDFGIVKCLAEPTRTQTGALMGTPPYMSPEQFCDAGAVDTRSDVWSLGVVLYEMCTGRRPFDADGTAALFAKISEGDYEPLRGVPDRMVRAIAGALQPDRSQRWADAAEMLAAWRGDRSDDAVLGCDPATVAAARALTPRLPPPARAPAPAIAAPSRSRSWVAAAGVLAGTALVTASALTTALILVAYAAS